MINADNSNADKEYLDQFLTETEQAKISQFWMDEIMREAIRKILLFSLYNCGVISKGKVHRSHVNFALIGAEDKNLSDEKLGKEIKIRWAGVQLLATAFNDISKYKLEEIPKLKGNPAR
jgi:hypothetical protein